MVPVSNFKFYGHKDKSRHNCNQYFHPWAISDRNNAILSES